MWAGSAACSRRSTATSTSSCRRVLSAHEQVYRHTAADPSWRGECLHDLGSIGGVSDSQAHGIWARRSPDPNSVWACEFRLNEAADDECVFRRDGRVPRPLDEIGGTRGRIPFLCPEIVLLYKAGEQSPKNEANFAAAGPRLAARRGGWRSANYGGREPPVDQRSGHVLRAPVPGFLGRPTRTRDLSRVVESCPVSS
jgi:hypothetical protein